MVSTRRSGDFIEDSNALTLRSRTIDIESRHPNSASASHAPGERGTPRKRRKVGGEHDEHANEVKTQSPGQEGPVATAGSRADTGEETPSAPVTAAMNSMPVAVGDDVEATGSSEHVDRATPPEPGPAGELDGARRIHKRFRSEEPESDMGNELDSTAVVTESKPVNAQASLRDSSTDASDDEGAPETFRTDVEQTLPFPPTAKEPKRKKRKPTKSTPKDADHGGSPPLSSPQAEIPSDALDDQVSLPIPDALPTSRREAKARRSAPKRPKDFKKDGVIYRTVASDGMRGQTSTWLPAKASQESRRIKDGLLVRKRVQEVWHGRRVRFVTSR